MKKNGPDSLNSWAVALVCSFLTMMMYGMTRLSGVLFVASMSRFGVNREKASFPYVLCDFMQCLSGPLVGYLGHKFGLRTIVTLGCLLASVGAGSCFFAENIGTVTFLWGVTFGYFRDKLGSYEYMFYLMGFLSLLCSISFFFSSSLIKRQKQITKDSIKSKDEQIKHKTGDQSGDNSTNL